MPSNLSSFRPTFDLFIIKQFSRISIPLLSLSLQSFDQNFLKYNSFNCAGNSKEPIPGALENPPFQIPILSRTDRPSFPSIHDFLISDLPCTVRRFLLLSDRHSLGQARRTREEKELVGRGERRQRETRRNVKCRHTKEGTARVERVIGRNLLRPEKGTKRKKRAS